MNNTAVTIYKIILPALILVTPFLIFVNYNSYCFACGETWIILSGLVVLAIICSFFMLVAGWIASGLIMAVLITVFVDLQFTPANLRDWTENWAAVLFFCGIQTLILCSFLKEKFYSIATAVFLTFFVVTISQIAFKASDSTTLFKYRESGEQALPRIIHLILDEHIGVEGIPNDIDGGISIKNLITDFYLENGFQLFGGAYSHYFYTHTSIGNMLNYSSGSHPTALIRGRGPYDLLSNAYFKVLAAKKYRIEVLSPGWLHFCSDSTIVVNACTEKDWRDLTQFPKLHLPISQRLQVLYGRYASQSIIVTSMIYAIAFPLQLRFPALASSIAQWTWALDPERARTDSLNTLADLKVLWSDIASLPQGTALFAHLSLPHYPYVALSDCSIRAPSRFFLWNQRTLFNRPTNNTTVSRKQHYQEYFEQLRCLYLRLDGLFHQMRAAGIYDDSIILIHGDHGSRIVMTEPASENRQALTKQDLQDGFSTLFAIKLPGKSGGYDKSAWPLEQLFAKFSFEAGLTPPNNVPERSNPYVYLTTDDDGEFVPIPYIPPK
jgi:hypothetical protein